MEQLSLFEYNDVNNSGFVCKGLTGREILDVYKKLLSKSNTVFLDGHELIDLLFTKLTTKNQT